MEIENWYDALVQLCNAQLQQVPELSKVSKYFEQGYSPEDTHDALFNRGVITVEQQSSQLAHGNKPSDHLKRVMEGTEYPHMTERDILAKITHKEFMLSPSGSMVLCEVTMRNGWRFIGKWAPISSENFEIEKGKSRALTDAIKQAWDFEAYLLKDKMREEYESLLAAGL